MDKKYSFGQQIVTPDNQGIITVRGFLYETENGQWILSQEPQLKTCCVGSQSKVMDQIYLEGTFKNHPLDGVVEVSGVFKVEPKYSQADQLIQYYTLEDAQIIASSQGFDAWVFLAFIPVVLIGYCVCFPSLKRT